VVISYAELCEMLHFPKLNEKKKSDVISN
jgi:hypothetical protein